MNKILLILSILCLFYSCNKYDIPKCDFGDPSEDLLWLKAIIDEREANPTEDMVYCYIVQGKLKRKTVFVFVDCNPSINKAIFVVNCEGYNVKNKDGRDIEVSEVDLKDERVIWQPKDFACDPSLIDL